MTQSNLLNDQSYIGFLKNINLLQQLYAFIFDNIENRNHEACLVLKTTFTYVIISIYMKNYFRLLFSR